MTYMFESNLHQERCKYCRQSWRNADPVQRRCWEIPAEIWTNQSSEMLHRVSAVYNTNIINDTAVKDLCCSANYSIKDKHFLHIKATSNFTKNCTRLQMQTDDTTTWFCP